MRDVSSSHRCSFPQPQPLLRVAARVSDVRSASEGTGGRGDLADASRARDPALEGIGVVSPHLMAVMEGGVAGRRASSDKGLAVAAAVLSR